MCGNLRRAISCEGMYFCFCVKQAAIFDCRTEALVALFALYRVADMTLLDSWAPGHVAVV